MQNILEARVEFQSGRINMITVLVEFSKGDIRAIQGKNRPMGGYMNIPSNAKLTDTLLQEVADYGMEVNPSNYFKKSKFLKSA